MNRSQKNNRININWIGDDDLNYLNYSGNDVYLDPKAIIYRGYDQEYEQVDTLRRYGPQRALYYGSFYSAMAYTYRAEKVTEFPLSRGPVYRFWSVYPVKLYSLNKRNTKYLVRYYLNKNDLITAARLIYAYGYLQSLSQGYDIVTSLLEEINNEEPNLPMHIMNKKDKKMIWDTVNSLIGSLESSLNIALNNCIQECDAKNIQNEERENVLRRLCKQECLSSTSRDSIGRKSQYEIDKPLIVSLGIYLKRQGYGGIFTPVDKKYSSFGHEIIIFNSKKDLETDNVNVIDECLSLTAPNIMFYIPEQLYLKNCPKAKSKKDISKFKKRKSVLAHIPDKYRKFILELYNTKYKHINPIDFVNVADQFFEVFSEEAEEEKGKKLEEEKLGKNKYGSKEERIENLLDRIHEKIFYQVSREDFKNSNEEVFQNLIIKYKLF